MLFHAGTKADGDAVKTAGGRVFACIGLDGELEKAVQKAYGVAEAVQYAGKTLRKDIGTVG